MSSRFEVQGIVSAKTGEPLVQFRQLWDDDREPLEFQVAPMEAREMSQQIIEAAANAVYDAALFSWAKTRWPDSPHVGAELVDAVRRHRADSWGLPDSPEDWRP